MSSGTAMRVSGFMREQRLVLVDFLQRLVEAESPSTEPGAHQDVIAVLADALEVLGYRVSLPRGKTSYCHVYARRRGRSRALPAQLVLGHLDTVWPLGTTSKRPFSVDGNVIRGPGVFDMKGGLAQLLLALRAVRELDLQMPLEPLVFVNADEEIGSRTSTRYIRALARIARRAYVLEPSLGEDGALKTERKGVGRFTIEVTGKAAHAGLDPGGGASAILELSHVIQALFALNNVEAGITVNVGTIDGGLQPNVVAPHSRAIVDVRVPTAADGARIETAIRGLRPTVDGVSLCVSGGIGRPSLEQTPRNRRLWRQAQSLGNLLGLQLTEARAGGGSDGNTTSQYTATLDGLGPVGHGAHAEHEFLYLDRTLQRSALLALLLTAPAAEADPP